MSHPKLPGCLPPHKGWGNGGNGTPREPRVRRYPPQFAPLACVPTAIPADERPAHFALARRLFTELVQERSDLADGLAFRLPADAFEQVARFVAGERRCCPFLRFEIAAAPDGGPVQLWMTGPPGTPDFLRAELRL